MFEIFNIKKPECATNIGEYNRCRTKDSDEGILRTAWYPYDSRSANKNYFENYFPKYDEINNMVFSYIFEKIKFCQNEHINIAIIGGGSLLEVYELNKIAQKYPFKKINLIIIDKFFWPYNVFEYLKIENQFNELSNLNNVSFYKGDFFEILEAEKEKNKLINKNYILFFSRSLLYGEKAHNSENKYGYKDDQYIEDVTNLLLPYKSNAIVNILSCGLALLCPTDEQVNDGKEVGLYLENERLDFLLKEEFINKGFNVDLISLPKERFYKVYFINQSNLYKDKGIFNSANNAFSTSNSHQKIDETRKKITIKNDYGTVIYIEDGRNKIYFEGDSYKEWDDLKPTTKILIKKVIDNN